jgi:hypothetical protein
MASCVMKVKSRFQQIDDRLADLNPAGRRQTHKVPSGGADVRRAGPLARRASDDKQADEANPWRR